MKKYFILAMLVLSACAKNETIGENTTFTFSNKRPLMVQGQYGGVKKESCLAEDLGNYAKFLAPSDYIITISKSSMPNIGATRSCLNVGKRDGCGFTKISDYSELPHEITINGTPIDVLVKKPEAENIINNFFGEKIRIKKNNKPFGKRDLVDPDDPGDPILPDEIHITSPDLTSCASYPLCYYGNYVLEWTEDMSNTDGILIVVEWNGTMVFGEHYSNTYIRSIDLVEDDGEVTLNPLMFEGIPDTALCFITVLRGQVFFDDDDVTQYSVMADCSETIPFVLIRNIETSAI